MLVLRFADSDAAQEWAQALRSCMCNEGLAAKNAGGGAGWCGAGEQVRSEGGSSQDTSIGGAAGCDLASMRKAVEDEVRSAFALYSEHCLCGATRTSCADSSRALPHRFLSGAGVYVLSIVPALTTPAPW